MNYITFAFCLVLIYCKTSAQDLPRSHKDSRQDFISGDLRDLPRQGGIKEIVYHDSTQCSTFRTQGAEMQMCPSEMHCSTVNFYKDGDTNGPKIQAAVLARLLFETGLMTPQLFEKAINEPCVWTNVKGDTIREPVTSYSLKNSSLVCIKSGSTKENTGKKISYEIVVAFDGKMFDCILILPGKRKPTPKNIAAYLSSAHIWRLIYFRPNIS